MPNIELLPYSRPSMWRKMSFANWGRSRDPQVYGRLEVDMSTALPYAQRMTEETGEKVTVTHLIVRAVGLALRRNPEANCIVRWNRAYVRKNVDIFCQVAIPGEKPDLSGATIRNVDEKKADMLAAELRERAKKVRAGKDKEFADSRKLMDRLPTPVTRFLLWLMGLITYTLNVDLKAFGLPRDPFGGAMVTSVGSLGISEAYPPLVPMSRVPVLICVGKLEDKPVVRDGGIVIRPMCVLTCTFDHRVMDGVTAGKLATTLLEYLEAPVAFESEK